MMLVALRMIMGDRMKFLGLLIGLTFAAMLITQQAAIFLGYTTRTWAFIDDTPHPDLWVLDPQVRFTEDPKPVTDASLYRVRGTPGVAWATPMYRSGLLVQTDDGAQELCTVVGVDDATLMGAPRTMIDGRAEDLRQSGGVIVDETAANSELRVSDGSGSTRPLRVGDTLSINDHSARVVGICRNTTPFYWTPVIYTTYSRALGFAPGQRKLMTYVLVGLAPGADAGLVSDDIAARTGLKAYTKSGFARLTAEYTLVKTGILINFGITIALGVLIGLLVCGQTFFNYVVDNARLFAALKALGLSNAGVLRMVCVQVLAVGVLGYGLGVGLASLSGTLLGKVGLSFHLPWQLLVGSFVAVMGICLATACLSSLRVLRLEPGVVFKA